MLSHLLRAPKMETRRAGVEDTVDPGVPAELEGPVRNIPHPLPQDVGFSPDPVGHAPTPGNRFGCAELTAILSGASPLPSGSLVGGAYSSSNPSSSRIAYS